MKKQTLQSKHMRLWRLLATLVLLGGTGYFVSSHLSTLHQSLLALRQANTGWVVLAACLMLLTFFIAAAIYWLLTLHPIKYFQTVTVELAAAFANRLLPAGLGGLGLHGIYLYRRRHTAAQATAIVSVNNLLGITTHVSLLLILIIVYPEVLQRFDAHNNIVHWWYAVIGTVALVILFTMPRLRNDLKRFVVNLFASFRLLHAGRIVIAVVLALLLTTTYTFILLGSAHAVGLHIGTLQVFVVFSLGMLAGTATPTPGGLVGTEAGLFAGFIAYGAAQPAAGAAVLLYRLLTYWLPLVPGAFALLLARKRTLL